MTIPELQDILDRLGVEVFAIHGSEFQGHCPAHLSRTGKEDSNPSWYINADTGKHICFSCQFKGGLSTLMEFVQGISFEEVGPWVTSGEHNLTRAYERLITPTPTASEPALITESMLSAFVFPPVSALTARGISLLGAEYYNLLWDTQKNSWITVIRDPYTNKLLGWQEKGHVERHFRNYPVGVNKSTAVFGYHQYTGGDMIVVESPLDAARLASVGILGGVSTYGAAVSHAQINIIRSADRVIFAMDNDKAGTSSSLDLLETSKKMGFECWFFNYNSTDMKDIGGMSKSEIVYGLTNARHSIYGKRAII